MSKEKLIDYKEYARQMRENCARDYNGTEPIVICSSELWEEIATIIEGFDKQSDGEWVRDFDGDYYCSKCGAYPKSYVKNHECPPYCPNCGAEMRKEDENEQRGL